MANHLFPTGRQKFLEGSIAWLSDTIKATLVSATYVQSDAHDFFDDVSGVIATSSALAGKTSTSGVAGANAWTYAAVAGGSTGTGIVVWKDTGTPATSPLIAWYDTKGDTTPISVVTNGGDIIVTPSTGADKMFRL